MVLVTFGKLHSVRTPSPPTAGPHVNGPAVRSINANLAEYIQQGTTYYKFSLLIYNIYLYISSNIRVKMCNWMSVRQTDRDLTCPFQSMHQKDIPHEDHSNLHSLIPFEGEASYHYFFHSIAMKRRKKNNEQHHQISK